jgi:hypothetical protein
MALGLFVIKLRLLAMEFIVFVAMVVVVLLLGHMIAYSNILAQ